MSFQGGTYAAHTVTVVGYVEFTNGSKTAHLIRIYDGWTSSYRYIGWDAISVLSGVVFLVDNVQAK